MIIVICSCIRFYQSNITHFSNFCYISLHRAGFFILDCLQVLFETLIFSGFVAFLLVNGRVSVPSKYSYFTLIVNVAGFHADAL